MALEQSTRADGRKDSIFFVYYTQYDEKKVGGSLRSKLRPIITLVRVRRGQIADCVWFCVVFLVSSSVHKRSDGAGPCPPGRPLCLCHVHGAADQAAMAPGAGGGDREGHERLGNTPF